MRAGPTHLRHNFNLISVYIRLTFNIISTQIPHDFDIASALVGPKIASEIGSDSTEMGPISTKCGPSSDKLGLESTKFGLTATKFGSAWAKAGIVQNRPDFDQLWSKLGEVRAAFAWSRPNLSDDQTL